MFGFEVPTDEGTWDLSKKAELEPTGTVGCGTTSSISKLLTSLDRF